MRPWRIVALVALLTFAIAASVSRAEDPLPPDHDREAPPITLSYPDSLKDPCGVAIDSTDRIFVANYYQHAVYVFLPSGELEQRIEIDQPPLAPNGKAVNGPCDLAIDSHGNLYVNRWHYDVLRFPRLSSSPADFGPAAVLDAQGSTSVTVDSSDHVYVDDRTYIAKYEPSGAAVLDGYGEPLKIGLGSLGSGYGVAVSDFVGVPGFPSTAGLVYVADAADDTVKVFDPAKGPSVLVEAIDGGATRQLGFSHLRDADLAVDPADGHLYVVDNLQPFFEEPEAVVDEFSSLGYFRGTVPTGSDTGHATNVIDGEPSAIAVDAGKLYLTSGNYFHDNDERTHPDSQLLLFGPGATVETGILRVVKSGSGAGTVFSGRPGLRCGTACKGEFVDGSIVALTATAAPHSRFVGWTGCTPLAGSPSQCQLTMTATPEVGAELEAIPQLPLTVTRSGGGSGNVFSVPAALECGGDCEASFDEGSSVTLSAEPAAGSFLAGWVGCDAEPVTGTCVVGMDAARSVTARFDTLPEAKPLSPPALPSRTLAVSVVGTGSTGGTVVSEPTGIDCGSTCARLYAGGSVVTLRANPASRSKLLGWGGCDSSNGPTCTVAMSGDKRIVAAFGPGLRGVLRARRLLARGDAGTLRVSVPAAGVLTVSGKGLLPREQLPLRAGETAVPIRLDAAGRRSLSRARGGKLKRTLALAFTPFDGGDTIRATAAATFELNRGRVRKPGASPRLPPPATSALPRRRWISSPGRGL